MITDEPDHAVEFKHADMPCDAVGKKSLEALNCNGILLDPSHLTSLCLITGRDTALHESTMLRSNAKQNPRRGV